MKNILITITLIFVLLIAGCKKYLDEKPDGHLEIPTTLIDFQALLDYYPTINTRDPGSGEVSADNYYLFTADYLALSQDVNRYMYTWQKSNLYLPQVNEWFNVYNPVFTANTILEGLNNLAVTAANQQDYNNVKGEALFVRGKAFYLAASLWTSVYDPTTASTQLGIPLRLGTDFNVTSTRSNLQESYSQIIADLSEAVKLLPVSPFQVLRPSKPAAFALLARTYLSMRQYDKAGLYADSCLQIYSQLVDYNNLNASATFPIAKFNAEVIQESSMQTPTPITNTRARIDTLLYRSYASNDLRKSIFFKSSTNGSFVFKGSYEGSSTLFAGIATDEVYLMRAECFARAGQTSQAMNDLNTLLSKRYKKGTFVVLTAATSNDALNQILTERRKELLMRDLRWMDLKRLNKDGANITLIRIVNGQTYTLPPNDFRYALPIPDDIIQLTGMQQNPR